MTPRVLFIISSDPRQSGKPAEAIRIAAGISAWKKTEVSVYLRDSAALVLSDDTTDLINEDNFTRYLPMLAELDRPIYVQQNASALKHLGETPVRIEPLADDALAKMAAAQTYVLRF